MYYYEVFYETTPSSIPLDLKESATDIRLIFYFEANKKLDSDGIRNAVEYYLKEQKIKYVELLISEVNEITGEEYHSHTQYE